MYTKDTLKKVKKQLFKFVNEPMMPNLYFNLVYLVGINLGSKYFD